MRRARARPALETVLLMLEKHKMDRINELARASKVRALSEAEKAEQAELRAEYLEKFREGFRAQLEQIEIVDGDNITQNRAGRKN